MNNYRHGETVLLGIESLPRGLKETSTQLNTGSHGHAHGFVNGTFYVKKEGDNTVGYFKADKGCYLTHPEHGVGDGGLKKAPIEEGFYKVLIQLEDTHAGFKVVVD